MGMEIEVTSGVMATLLAEAERASPEECCGLLMGDKRRITAAVPTANRAPEPARHFEIDPAALIAAHRAERAGGPRLLGYYHSHPSGHPLPSARDCEHAAGDSRAWAIIAGGEVRFYRDTPEGFTVLCFTVIDG
jgi:proteasome lid subunit RPN8/RPN11